jgi:hypothetical protein
LQASRKIPFPFKNDPFLLPVGANPTGPGTFRLLPAARHHR